MKPRYGALKDMERFERVLPIDAPHPDFQRMRDAFPHLLQLWREVLDVEADDGFEDAPVLWDNVIASLNALDAFEDVADSDGIPRERS
jgi:hypothetical protein